MPAATGEKKNRGKSALKTPTNTVTQNTSKKTSERPAAEIFKATSLEIQDEHSWFEPSVKGIDRARPPPAPAACNRAPVIMLYGINDYNKLYNLMLENLEKGDFIFKMHSDRFALEIKKVCKFVRAVKLLNELGVQYHYKNTYEDKCERYVLRGIPAEFETAISNGLKQKGFYVRDVHRLIGPKSSLRNPVFVLCHTPLPEGPSLTEVKIISKWMVKIELYKGTKREPMLCFRCSRFAHTATFCTVNPRCFKCAGEHEGSTCSEPVVYKCCNCSGQHPATSKCCPMYQRVKEYNTNARPKPPSLGMESSAADVLAASISRLELKEVEVQKPRSRLPKLIAKSFVMVAWNAQGTDVENCPEFLRFLEVQGAQLAYISGSHSLSKDRWNTLGWSVLGVTDSAVRGKRNAVWPTILIRQNVAHTRLTMPSLKHMSAVVASVETKSASVKVAVAYVGPNDSFVSEDLVALFKGPEPTVVFGDMYARHHEWNSPVNNRRGKTLKRVAEVCKFSVIGPMNPSRFYKEEEVPFVVLAKKIPPALSILPKRIKSVDNSVDHLCPMVMHLRNWRRPKMSKTLDLPADLKELIREKNRLRRQWQRTRFSLFKEELNITKASVKAKLDDFRRRANKCQMKHASNQI